MSVINLSGDQLDALKRMRNGCILNGSVGSGKSRTALAYYYTKCGGEVNTNKYVVMNHPRDLYIITTAKKRDTLEWEEELAQFYLSPEPEHSIIKNKIVVDSWNNIKKYVSVVDAFFIFDEQRVVGYGVWTKSFLKIAAKNRWILLTATPGDTWHDYVPVFIANGFFKNKTDFERRHCVWSRYTKWPKVEKYIDEARLLRYRNSILINLDYEKKTIPRHSYICTGYDEYKYKYVTQERWNVFTNEPIENAGEYCLVLRRIVNSSKDRQIQLLDTLKKHPKAIIFYNYNFELEILHELFADVYPMAEWNGHLHQPVPTGDHWVYLVQYTAGAEGWNCITTDTIIFYSESYSYKQMVQAAGRIDRRNTPFVDLYYIHFTTTSKIDRTISKALKGKKKFNEKGFAPDFSKPIDKKEPKPIQLTLFD